MEIEIKSFEALSVNELYELLALRNEVFIIEQNCVYQDLDGYDQKALHVLVRDNDELAAYARIFNSGINCCNNGVTNKRSQLTFAKCKLYVGHCAICLTFI